MNRPAYERASVGSGTVTESTTTTEVESTVPCGSTSAAGSRAWTPLRLEAWCALAFVIVTLLVAAIPQLPPGVCFSDAGDFQLASTTLGIMHPPGYAGYAAVGWLFTRVPGVDPAYMVSLMCLACGVVALTVCLLIQVRLGVSPWIAGALVLALTAHSRVWTNLVVPEVYMPTLALVVGAAYLLAAHLQTGRLGWLWWAAFLYGFAVANRPTAVWSFPFFAIAWWVGVRRRDGFPRGAVRPVAIATLCAAAPGLFSVGYLWARDTPDIAYNYIEIHNREVGDLPMASEGSQAKLQRLWYHGTAREFSRFMKTDLRFAWRRVRWIYKEFFLYRPDQFAIVLFILAAGVVVALRRNVPMTLLAAGLALGNVIFICTYDIYGMAADLSMLLTAATVMGGMALAPLFPDQARGWRRAVPVALAVGVAVWTVAAAPRRAVRAQSDALPYLHDLDMATLPTDAVICSTWKQTPPLLFDKYLLSRRPDIEIINATTRLWARQAAAFPGRPLFAVSSPREAVELRMTPFRNIWRAERVGADAPSNAKKQNAARVVPP